MLRLAEVIIGRLLLRTCTAIINEDVKRQYLVLNEVGASPIKLSSEINLKMLTARNDDGKPKLWDLDLEIEAMMVKVSTPIQQILSIVRIAGFKESEFQLKK
jgi:hypothetical protein